MATYLGVDAGNENGKIVGKFGELIYKTALSEFNTFSEETFGPDDMIIEYQGQKMFGGSVAKYDGEFSGSIMGGTKAHSDTLIRVLVAIHRYLIYYDFYETEFKIVVGQPIDFHNEAEKQKIINMLEGNHEITVNEVKKKISILKALVSKETPFWAEPEIGLVRHIEVGSGTINLSTFLDKKYISKDSKTLTFGMESTKSKDRNAMSRAVVAETSKKWGMHDKIKLAGGGSKELYNHINSFYPNTYILKPKLYLSGRLKVLDPIYANAVAFYNTAIRMFEHADS